MAFIPSPLTIISQIGGKRLRDTTRKSLQSLRTYPLTPPQALPRIFLMAFVAINTFSPAFALTVHKPDCTYLSSLKTNCTTRFFVFIVLHM